MVTDFVVVNVNTAATIVAASSDYNHRMIDRLVVILLIRYAMTGTIRYRTSEKVIP